MTTILSQCSLCVHYVSQAQSCAAFPQGISNAVLLNDQDHRTRLYGDKGIVWAPADEVEDDMHPLAEIPEPRAAASPYGVPGTAEYAKAYYLANKAKKAGAAAAATPVKKQEAPQQPSLGVLDVSQMQKLGGQAGSNPGGFYQAGDGSKYYIKRGKSEAHVDNELLAGDLYREAGVAVPEMTEAKWSDGARAVASKIVPDAKQIGSEVGKLPGAADGLVVDAWLANWDVAGSAGDYNIVASNGKAMRLDVGGALTYRAQGAPKGSAFGNDPTELHTLRDSSKNHQASKVFAGVTEADLKAGAERLTRISDSRINELVSRRNGPAGLAEKLIERKKRLVTQLLGEHRAMAGSLGIPYKAGTAAYAKAYYELHKKKKGGGVPSAPAAAPSGEMQGPPAPLPEMFGPASPFSTEPKVKQKHGIPFKAGTKEYVQTYAALKKAKAKFGDDIEMQKQEDGSVSIVGKLDGLVYDNIKPHPKPNAPAAPVDDGTAIPGPKAAPAAAAPPAPKQQAYDPNAPQVQPAMISALSPTAKKNYGDFTTTASDAAKDAATKLIAKAQSLAGPSGNNISITTSTGGSGNLFVTIPATGTEPATTFKVDKTTGAVVPVATQYAGQAPKSVAVKEDKPAVHPDKFGTATLTYDERQSIAVYKGSGYVEINKQLRKKSGVLGPTVAGHVKNIDSAMAKFKPLDEELVVRRGAGHGSFYDNLYAGGAGTHFQDGAYVSTARSGHGFGGQNRMIITLPKGTRALDFGHQFQKSGNDGEAEVLLPRGQRFLVTKTETGMHGVRTVHMRLIPHSAEQGGS